MPQRRRNGLVAVACILDYSVFKEQKGVEAFVSDRNRLVFGRGTRDWGHGTAWGTPEAFNLNNRRWNPGGMKPADAAPSSSQPRRG